MRLIPQLALGVWIGLLLTACSTPSDPVERQFQCMEDPECRARLEHSH